MSRLLPFNDIRDTMNKMLIHFRCISEMRLSSCGIKFDRKICGHLYFQRNVAYLDVFHLVRVLLPFNIS